MSSENGLCDACGAKCRDEKTGNEFYGLLLTRKDEKNPKLNIDFALCGICFQGGLLMMAKQFLQTKVAV